MSMRRCKIDGQECDFFYTFVRPKNCHYWINTSTCHQSFKGFPTSTYNCTEILL